MHSSGYYGAEICFAARVVNDFFSDEVEILNEISVSTEIKFLMKMYFPLPFSITLCTE
jgi:hypothetical protein